MYYLDHCFTPEEEELIGKDCYFACNVAYTLSHTAQYCATLNESVSLYIDVKFMHLKRYILCSDTKYYLPSFFARGLLT